MLVIYGLEATNIGFITLIQALCQQSFGLTLPQNCVRPRGPEMRSVRSPSNVTEGADLRGRPFLSHAFTGRAATEGRPCSYAQHPTYEIAYGRTAAEDFSVSSACSYG